jgi:hypothetical protein
VEDAEEEEEEEEGGESVVFTVRVVTVTVRTFSSLFSR